MRQACPPRQACFLIVSFKFQFNALFKTFPLGGRCPRKGADEGNILPLISQKSKIFASFSPGRSFCACGAKEYDRSQFDF